MGNNHSDGNGNHLIRWTEAPGTKREIVRAVARYTESQRVTIEGRALDCTIDVSDAVIIVKDNRHRITILGSNNKIAIQGSDVLLRIEGNENDLSGSGERITIYSDSEYFISDLKVVCKEKLTDDNGNQSANAPPKLELKPLTEQNAPRGGLTIRYSFTLREEDSSTDTKAEKTEPHPNLGGSKPDPDCKHDIPPSQTPANTSEEPQPKKPKKD